MRFALVPLLAIHTAAFADVREPPHFGPNEGQVLQILIDGRFGVISIQRVQRGRGAK